MNNSFWDAAEQAVLARILIGTAMPDWTPVKVSLHTAEPGGTGANEVSGGSYARLQVDTDKWTAPVGIGNGSASYNVEDLVYADMPSTAVAFAGFWSNDETVFIMSAPLDVAQSVTAGATFKILAGKLQVRLN